jgi:LysM repeat protein
MATYTVQSGDTLYGIARKFNTTVQAIELVNPGIRPRHLRIGQVINLPGARPTPTPASTPTPTPTGQYLFVDEGGSPSGTAFPVDFMTDYVRVWA